jgi:acetylglutamate kinase
MIPKLEHAFQALEAGISRVRICHAHELAQADSGTILCR